MRMDWRINEMKDSKIITISISEKFIKQGLCPECGGWGGWLVNCDTCGK